MSFLSLRQTGLGRLLVVSLCCVLFLGTATGCEDSQQTQTAAFEIAETHYHDGEYEAALDGYQAFLEAYPNSPLAKTAELRIRCIHREVSGVLMQKEMPRPRYLAGEDDDDVDELPEAVR